MKLFGNISVFDIREHSQYHCTLTGYNFVKASLTNKVRLCIRAGIFQLQEINNNKDIPYNSDEQLNDINFRNNQSYGESKSTFLFCSVFISTCKKYMTYPNDAYEKEVFNYFFRAYGNNFNTQFDRIKSLIDKTGDSIKKVMIEEKILALASKPYNFLKWKFDEYSNEY